MRFICSTFGSSGDVFPMLGLAVELALRGHEVTFATNEHYGAMTRECGLKFESLGTEEEFETSIKDPDIWKPVKAFACIFGYLKPALKRQFEVHARPGTVGITNCLGFGALMAQDALKIPVITMHVQPGVLWSDVDPPTLAGVFGPRWLKSLMFRFGERFFLDPVVSPFLNSWRRELGLPPMRQITRWWSSPYGVLCMFPEWFAARQPDWPAKLVQTDFPLWNHRSDQQMAAEVEDFLRRGERPIVFTPGSTNIQAEAFFRAAVEACQALGRRGILLTEFPEQLPAGLPDGVVHFSYVPLDLLLPRSAAFVHHGGVGSTSQAMLAGIPQVLTPMAHDQFDNAERVRRLNVGDAIPATRFSGARLTVMLRRLLDSVEVGRACREVARKLAAKDGLKRSAEAVERMVAGR